MNPDNIGTREACQKLFDTGIVVETEACWYRQYHEWLLLPKTILNDAHYPESIPALSMAEAWRELPDSFLWEDNLWESGMI